MLCILLVSVAN